MNKLHYLSILFWTCISQIVVGQIVCIKCYDQNDSISSGVNNLLFNGGFEDGCGVGANGYFCPNSIYYKCDITNWTCTGGGDSTYATVWSGGSTMHVEGAKGVYFGNRYPRACSSTIDDTSCFNGTPCEVMGIPVGYPINDTAYGGTTGLSLEQTVTGLVIGDVYILEFWAGGEAATVWDKQGLFALNIGFGNVMLRCNPTPSSVGIGKTYIVEFKATATSHTIKFTNWGHICSSCTELVLDNVRLYTLAELSPTVTACTQPCPPLSLTYSITDATPGLNDGAVKVNVSGGSSPYLFSLDNITFQSNSTFTELDTGTYQIFVTDSNGCPAQGTFTVTYDTTVSTQNINSLNSIRIFPNPFSDELIIELSKENNIRIRLIDVLGREVLTQRYDNISTVKLNVTQIPEGVYYLEVLNNKGEKLHTTGVQIKAGVKIVN